MRSEKRSMINELGDKKNTREDRPSREEHTEEILYK